MQKITVTFDIQFGSDFQRDFFLKYLKAMLMGLKLFLEGSHKDNKINYEVDTNDGYKVRQV